MLSLSRETYQSLLDPELENNTVLPPDFFCMDHEKWSCFVFLLKDGERIGVGRWKVTDGVAELQFFVTVKKDHTLEILFHAAALFINRVIVTDHPERILYTGDDRLIMKAMGMNLFYPKGKIMQRIIEPYRYAVKDRTFDEEGYIIHQGLTEVLPFGLYSSRAKGCGWIAAYNLLKMNGCEKTMFDVSNELEDMDLLGESFGHSIFSLCRYLKKQGLAIEMTYMIKELCRSRLESSACGILMYYHRTGAHFAAYRRTENGKLHFYNAVYGMNCLELTVDEFVSTYTTMPVSSLLSMKKYRYEH